jgi:hypothetical protein
MLKYKTTYTPRPDVQHPQPRVEMAVSEMGDAESRAWNAWAQAHVEGLRDWTMSGLEIVADEAGSITGKLEKKLTKRIEALEAEVAKLRGDEDVVDFNAVKSAVRNRHVA